MPHNRINNGLSRRAFVRALGGAIPALALAPSLARAKPRGGKDLKRPSKLIVLNLEGGMDDMYTVDPKRPTEVKSGIGPTFDDLLEVGSLRVAKPWQSLGKYLEQMLVLTGVQVNTVAHITGHLQVRHMRTAIASPREPSFVKIAGQHLAADMPLHGYRLSGFFPMQGGEQVLMDQQNAAMLSALLKAANDEPARAATLAALANSQVSDPASLRTLSKLMGRLQGAAAPSLAVNRIPAEEWPALPRNILHSWKFDQFGWAKFALEHELAPVVMLSGGYNWDTHGTNSLQRQYNTQFAWLLRDLLDGLASVPRGGHSLLDETGIVILSEFGRFPYFNKTKGKDHFPQLSVTMLGPGLARGKFGETNAEQVGQPVSPTTGKPTKDAQTIRLDDVGRTLLEWIGHPSPAAHGYGGKVLEFCFS